MSYSHANKNIAHKVADRLKEVHNVWIDIDQLRAGDPIDMALSKGITKATLFLPFISDKYCTSNECMAEFALASSMRKKILPIMLVRSASNGIDYAIATLTMFYAFKPPDVFDPWSENLFKKLLNCILDLAQ